MARQRRRIQAISRYASEIIENPLCSHFQTRLCVSWYRIGFPLCAAALRVWERMEEAAGEEASEAAIFGKPAVVGGYGWDVLAATVPSELIPPSAICRVEGLYDTVKHLLENADYRRELGETVRSFVAEQ